METVDTHVTGTGLKEVDGFSTLVAHKADVPDEINDIQKEQKEVGENLYTSEHLSPIKVLLKWDNLSPNLSDYADLKDRGILPEKFEAGNKKNATHDEANVGGILEETSENPIWCDNEMSQTNGNHGNMCTFNKNSYKVQKTAELLRKVISLNKPENSINKLDKKYESLHTSTCDDDCSLFERTLQQLEKETTDTCYKLKFKSWKKRKEKLEKVDQNKETQSKRIDKKKSFVELIPSKEKSISFNHQYKYHTEHKRLRTRKSNSIHSKKNHHHSKSVSDKKDLKVFSKEEPAFICDLDVTSKDLPQPEKVPDKVYVPDKLLSVKKKDNVALDNELLSGKNEGKIDIKDKLLREKKPDEVKQHENDDVRHFDNADEKKESCFKSCYRLQHAQWKCSSKCALGLLKRKYHSVRILFAREPVVVLDRVDSDGSKMIGDNFEVISMWEAETDSSVCTENRDIEKEDQDDGVNLVDPRVMSLSRTLQSGQNGKVGAEKTFKNLSSKHTQAKTKVCFKLEAVKNSNIKKPVVQKPDWSLLKQKLKEVNDKQILKKMKDSKAVGKKFNKHSKSKQTPFHNEIKDHRKPVEKQESINSKKVNESVILERKRELEKLCSKSQDETENVAAKQEIVDESSKSLNISCISPSAELGEIQEMMSDSDVDLDSDFKIDGYSIELCQHSTDDDRSKEPSLDRDLISKDVKTEQQEGANQGNDQSTLRVTSGIIPNLYVSDNVRDLHVNEDDRSLSPPVLVRETQDNSEIKKESQEVYRYMIKEENESHNNVETATSEVKLNNANSTENECKVELTDVQNELKCSANDTGLKLDSHEVKSDSEALNHNTSNSGDNTQYLNSQSAAPNQGLNRDSSISPDHTSTNSSHVVSTSITSDTIYTNMSSSLTDAVLSDSADTLNYSDLLDEEMRQTYVESDEADDSDTDAEIVKIERELLSLSNDTKDLSKTDNSVRRWKTVSLSSSSSSSTSSDNENSASDRKSGNTQAIGKWYRSVSSKHKAISSDKKLSGNKTDENLRYLNDGTLSTNVQELMCVKSKKELKMDKRDKSILRQSSDGAIMEKLGKTSKKRKKSHDKSNLQDLEDLPKIPAPKRRHRPYSVGSYRPIRDLTQERLMQDLPNHNWLFNKYNAVSTDQKPASSKDEKYETGRSKSSNGQIDDLKTSQPLTTVETSNTKVGQPTNGGSDDTVNASIVDPVDKMIGQSINTIGMDDEVNDQTHTEGGIVNVMTSQSLSKTGMTESVTSLTKEGSSQNIPSKAFLTGGFGDKKTGKPFAYERMVEPISDNLLTKEGNVGTTSQQVTKAGQDRNITAKISKQGCMDSTMTDEIFSQREVNASITRCLNSEIGSASESLTFTDNQNTVAHFKKRLMNGKSKQDQINLHYDVNSSKNTKNNTSDNIKYTNGKTDEIVINQAASNPVTTHKSSENEHKQKSLKQTLNKENNVFHSGERICEDSTIKGIETVDQAIDQSEVLDLTKLCNTSTGLEPIVESSSRDTSIEENRGVVCVDETLPLIKNGKEEGNVYCKGKDDKSITENKINTGRKIKEMGSTALDINSSEKNNTHDPESPKEQKLSQSLSSSVVSSSTCPNKQQEDSVSLNVRQKPQPPVLRVQPHLYKPPGTRNELDSSSVEITSSFQLSTRDQERPSLSSGSQQEPSRTVNSSRDQILSTDVRLSSGLPAQSSSDVSVVPSLLPSNNHIRNTNPGMVNPVQPFVQTTVFNHSRQSHRQTSHIPISSNTPSSSPLASTTSTRLLIPRAVVPFNPTANVLLNQTQTNHSLVNRQEQALITVQNAPQVFEINPVTPLPSGNQVILLNNGSSVIPINTISGRNTQTIGPQVLGGVQVSQEQQQFGQILSSSQIIIAHPLDTRIANNSATMVESVPRVNTVNKNSNTPSVDHETNRNGRVLINHEVGGRDQSNTQRNTGEGGSSSNDDEDFRRQMEEIENEIKQKQKEQDEIRRKKMELLEKRKAAKSGVKATTEDVVQDTIKDEQNDTEHQSNNNTNSVEMANMDHSSRSDGNCNLANSQQNVQVSGNHISNALQSDTGSKLQGAKISEESRKNSQNGSTIPAVQKVTTEILRDTTDSHAKKTNNSDEEEDNFEGALVIDLSASSKEYINSNTCINRSQISKSTSSQKSKTDKIKIEEEIEIKSQEEKDNTIKTQNETENILPSNTNDDEGMNENSLQINGNMNENSLQGDRDMNENSLQGNGNMNENSLQDNRDINENSLQYIEDIGRINPFTGEYDKFDNAKSADQSLDLTNKSNNTDKASSKSDQEICEQGSESNQSNKQEEMQTNTSTSENKDKDLNSSNNAELVVNNYGNNLRGQLEASNEIVDLTCNNDINGIDLSAKPICVFTFKKEDERNESSSTFENNVSNIGVNDLSNGSQRKDQIKNEIIQGKNYNRTFEERRVITSEVASVALSALNQNDINQESDLDIDSEKQRAVNDNHVEKDTQTALDNSLETADAVKHDSKYHDADRSINLSTKVDKMQVSTSNTVETIVRTTESNVQVVTSGSQISTFSPIAVKTSVTSSVTLVTSTSNTNITRRYRELRCKPPVPENPPFVTQGNNISAQTPSPHNPQLTIPQEHASPPRSQSQANVQRPRQRDHSSNMAGILPFQCGHSGQRIEDERRNEREGWWHPQLKVQQHGQRRTRGMYIELEPAHSQPRKRKAPKGARPAPAHNQVVNMKEVFKKINKSHCCVPLSIQQSCPFIKRWEPVDESPEDILTDGKVKRDMGRIPEAHSQKPFSVAGHLIVSRKRALKRSASRSTKSPSPTRFASMPNTPPSPPERMRRSSSAMADIPVRECDGSVDSPLPSQRANSLEPVCPARAHTKINDLDNRSFSNLQTLKPPTTFYVDDRKSSSNRSLDVIDLTRLESPKREVIDSPVVNEQINKETEIQNEITAAMAKRRRLDNGVQEATRKTPNTTSLKISNNGNILNLMHSQLAPPIQSPQNRMQTPLSRPPRSRQPDYSRPRQVLAPVPVDRPLQAEPASQRLLHEAMFSPNSHGSPGINRPDQGQTDIARQSNYIARRIEFAQRMNIPNDGIPQGMYNRQNEPLSKRMMGHQGDPLVTDTGTKPTVYNSPIDHLSERIDGSPNSQLAQRMMANRSGEFLAQRIDQRPTPDKRMEMRPNDQPIQRVDDRQNEMIARRMDSRLHDGIVQRMDNRQNDPFAQPTNFHQQPPKLIQPNNHQYQGQMSYQQQMSTNRATNQRPQMVGYPEQLHTRATGVYPQGKQGPQRLPFHAQQTMSGNQGNVERTRQQHSRPDSIWQQQHPMSGQHSVMRGQHSVMSGQHNAMSSQHSVMSSQHSVMSSQHSDMSGQQHPILGHQPNAHVEVMPDQRQLNNPGQQHNQRPMMSAAPGIPLPNTRGDAAQAWAQIQKMQQIRANHIRNRQLQQNSQMNREAQIRQVNPVMSQQSPQDHFGQGQVSWTGYQHSPTQLQVVTQTSPTGHFQNIEQVLRHPSRFPGQHTQQIPGSRMNFPQRRVSDHIDIRQTPATKYYHLGPPEVQFITETNTMGKHQNLPVPNWSKAQMTHQAQFYNQGHPKLVQAPPTRTIEGHPGVETNIKMKSPHTPNIQQSPDSAYSPNTCLTSQHPAASQYQGHGGQGQMKDTPAQQEHSTGQPKQSGSPDQSTQMVEENLPHLQQVHGTCVLCGKYSLYLCSSCKKMWYCSPECQVSGQFNNYVVNFDSAFVPGVRCAVSRVSVDPLADPRK